MTIMTTFFQDTILSEKRTILSCKENKMVKIQMSYACNFDLQRSAADGNLCRCDAGFDHAQIRLVPMGGMRRRKIGRRLGYSRAKSGKIHRK